MARRSLRPQLNQIRAWVREGRTDAWIAHQLEVSASELKEFRRQHDLSPDTGDENGGDVDLRDEIEAEIEAAAAEEEALAREKAEKEAEEAAAREAADESGDGDGAASDAQAESDGGEAEGRPRRRRRRGRRGGARRDQGTGELEGTFDHGEEGYGLWLDPAIQDIAAYRDNWAGKRDVTVTIEADQIVIRRND